jgi:hypothetical protein
MSKIRFSFACASALLLAAPSFAQTPEPISIVIFGPPSLGAFLPPVIKAQSWTRKTVLRSSSRSARPTPIPRNSTPANSSSAVAHPC